jgi:hypothetical protein
MVQKPIKNTGTREITVVKDINLLLLWEVFKLKVDID